MEQEMHNIGIYIHIPFCKHKCAYCDFTSYEGKDEKREELYVKYLLKEIEMRLKGQNYYVETIYIGGGTPTYIKATYITQILNKIKEYAKVDINAEVTIEANPESLTLEKAEEYIHSGINRISIGLQSSNENLLKNVLERVHTYKDFENAIYIAKTAGFSNINADIITDIPGQTMEDVEDTIKKLIDLNLTHISVYALLYVKKFANVDQKDRPDEEIERYMYWYAKRKLEENGYVQYEISNFAKPGFECKHNIDCWNEKDYIGCGISASGHITRGAKAFRYTNTSNFDTYIQGIKDEKLENIYSGKWYSRSYMMSEYMILGLRKISGVDDLDFKAKFEVSFFNEFSKIIRKLYSEKLIDINRKQGKMWITRKGLDFFEQVEREFAPEVNNNDEILNNKGKEY